MWKFNSNNIDSERSIVRLIVIFVLVSVTLFLLLSLFLLLPRIDTVFNSLQTESEQKTVTIYSEQLRQYIKARELAVHDIANNHFVTNAVLLADGNNTAFKDYIVAAYLLGENPILTVLDVEGQVLFSELDDVIEYPWAMPLLNFPEDDGITHTEVTAAGEEKPQRLNVVNNSDITKGWFELAVPVFYERSVEGILVARFDASPSKIYKFTVDVSAESAVSYGKGGRMVSSNYSAIILPSKQSLLIEAYGLNFTHTASRKHAELQKKSFLGGLVFSVLLGAAIIFLLLFLLGRRIILQPYLNLVEAKELLVKREKEINANLIFQSLVFESIPDLTFVKDEGFRIVQANQAFLNAYPESMRDSIVGTTSIESFSPEEAEAFLEYDREAFEKGFSQTEETILFPDGVERILNTKKVRFQGLDGQNFILGLARDVTDIKAAENKLRQANIELEEFAYRTSHDLRSPLVSSLEMLNVIEKDVENNEVVRAKQCIGLVRKSLVNLDDLVKDILTLTKLRNVEEKKEWVDIDEVVDATLESFLQMDGFYSIEFKKELLHDNLILVERSRFVMILENLISNAIKYYDPSKESPQVVITSRTEKRKIIFSVSDNGLGIPESQHKKIFSMFKRFHPRTSFGSGLGLYMVKKSADFLGGAINYEALEAGSCFVLSLPINTPE
jgi:PAS domain S-box-containing protein